MTPFGQAITPRRSCATASVSFREITEVRRALGCTVNDVFLALGQRGACLVPRQPGAAPRAVAHRRHPCVDPDPGGGPVRKPPEHLVPPPRDRRARPDPRLEAIHRATQAVRRLTAARRSERLQADWMEHTLLFKSYIAFGSHMTKRAGRPPFNVLLSSVKGPRPLWFRGAPITEIQSYSQLAAGIRTQHHGVDLSRQAHCRIRRLPRARLRPVGPGRPAGPRPDRAAHCGRERGRATGPLMSGGGCDVGGRREP